MPVVVMFVVGFGDNSIKVQPLIVFVAVDIH